MMPKRLGSIAMSSWCTNRQWAHQLVECEFMRMERLGGSERARARFLSPCGFQLANED